MPPKAKKGDAPSKKTEMKKKEKIVEDKTFGMKNKKGTKQQKFVKMVNQQVMQGNQKGKIADKELAMKMETKKKDKAAELNALFKPVEQKVAKGVDPKSVLCAFFKQGQCKKGDKCKFSHDLNIARKSEKRSIYTDEKEDEENMGTWDETKLQEVVEKKHGSKNKSMPPTAIICKYFLEAVEASKYGWFWSCPNGENCHYKHALPPGFVLKKDAKKEDKGDQISLEELIERERAALSSQNLTKVTLESFLKWKERKRKEKITKAEAALEKKKADYKAGKGTGISGREMFEFNPDLIIGDDDEADDVVYKREESDDEEEGSPAREVNLDYLAAQAESKPQPGQSRVTDQTGQSAKGKSQENGPKEDESSKLDIAGALPPDPVSETDAAIAAAMAATVNGDMLAEDTPFDENLFDGEDLDIVEDELETLDLDD